MRTGIRLRLASWAVSFSFAPLVALGAEPGSGIYAAECSNSKKSISVDITPRGTATVRVGDETFADQLTSYSFFGKATPADFHIAILFDRDRPPLLRKAGPRSWLEIWKGEAAFYALPNGERENRLYFCAELPVAETQGPDFDCKAANGEVEKLICADEELARRDRALAAVYRKALGRIAGDDARIRTLKTEQRGWIKYRNDCRTAQDIRTCIGTHYGERHATLLAQFSLIEAGPTQLWHCSDGDAPLYATPFMTEPPTVNLVRGDKTTTAIQRPAASGSRYEAPFGVVFWTKGKDAMLTWPQGRKADCRYGGAWGNDGAVKSADLTPQTPEPVVSSQSIQPDRLV